MALVAVATSGSSPLITSRYRNDSAMRTITYASERVSIAGASEPAATSASISARTASTQRPSTGLWLDITIRSASSGSWRTNVRSGFDAVSAPSRFLVTSVKSAAPRPLLTRRAHWIVAANAAEMTSP